MVEDPEGRRGQQKLCEKKSKQKNQYGTLFIQTIAVAFLIMQPQFCEKKKKKKNTKTIHLGFEYMIVLFMNRIYNIMPSTLIIYTEIEKGNFFFFLNPSFGKFSFVNVDKTHSFQSLPSQVHHHRNNEMRSRFLCVCSCQQCQHNYKCQLFYGK